MPGILERLGSGQRAEWKAPEDIFLSSSETRDQYDTWIQAPARKLTFIRIGRTYQLDASGLFLLPVSAGVPQELTDELEQWQDAAVDAFWLFEEQLGEEK